MNGVRAEVMNGEARPRGTKRVHDEALDDDHRFAKRFHLLNIENKDKLYVSVASRPQQQQQQQQPPHQPTTPTTDGKPHKNDHMHLDDTKDRVYIHNLDDELADIESDEEKLIFLPDIEKRLGKIPKHVLIGKTPPELAERQELVLYSIPSSLSVPPEKDSVRKAILEARQRARDRASAAQEVVEHISRGPDNPEIAHGLDEADYLDHDSQDDPDAMDIG